MHPISFTHQNPGTTKPLVIPLQIVCNTDEEVVLQQVLENSRKVKTWVKTLPGHERVAVICGSSPSIEDHIEEIRQRQQEGAEIFALNNCANYLSGHGITADYQIIMDAQPHNLGLIGPAKTHLFASQCHPSLFDAVPDAVLWHATYGNRLVDEQEGFPEHDDEYCLIGSSATVGNTGLLLIWTLGYREFHIYGMDSSHRQDRGHVVHQSQNDGDPCMMTEYNGRQFLCSFTMKMQADTFMHRAKILEREGCKIHVYGDGLLSYMWNCPLVLNTEREKYEAMYQFPAYHAVSPGAQIVGTFVEVVKPKAGARIIDYGCATGMASVRLREQTECEVWQIDFASNSRNTGCLDFQFLQHDLTEPIPVLADYGFCADVMEHIEPEKVDQTLRNIMDSCGRCFFQISNVDDDMGELIGYALHLTVQPPEWWHQKFQDLGYAVTWSAVEGNASMFYVQNP